MVVQVIELLEAFLFTIDIEGIEAALPDAVA